ncbi:MAG: hypothetical protein IJS16_05115 [Butyrivibrio sp.]|nr:hypothetical protein [Butyrivibrio sp.]
MKIVHTKRSLVEETYNQYSKLLNALSNWQQKLENGDAGLSAANDGQAEDSRHESNRVFLFGNGNLPGTMEAVFHMKLTLQIAKQLVKGLILCADDFINVLKGEEVYDLDTYNNCAQSVNDILLFDDSYCPEASYYYGQIESSSSSITANSIKADIYLGVLDEDLKKLEIMSVDISSYEDVVRDCNKKQKRVTPLFDFLTVFGKGCKTLNDFVYDNLSPYVTAEGAREHVRPFIYDGEIGPCDENITKALEGLPVDVDLSDVSYTDDGYVLVKKSLGELLEEKYGGDWSQYNDYYLTGLEVDGEVRFSIVMVPVGGSVVVPFKDFDVGSLSGTESDVRAKLEKSVETTMKSKDLSIKDQELTDYYADPNSKGNYLIADLIVDKSMEQQADNVRQGRYVLLNSYDSQDSWCRAQLDELERKGIYDRETNTITFDPNNVSNDAYNAILMDSTGDPDTFAYAGENQYHAVRLNRYGSVLSDHTYESDAGVGESKNGKYYEYHFKDPDGAYEIADQKEAHG